MAREVAAPGSCSCTCHSGMAKHIGPCKCQRPKPLGLRTPLDIHKKPPEPKKWFVDLFAGTGSGTEAFADDQGWYGTYVELDKEPARKLRLKRMRHAVLVRDVLNLEPGRYPFEDDQRPTFLWASVPCTTFSMSAVSKHWDAYSRCETCGADIRRISDKKWEGCGDSGRPGSAADHPARPSPGGLRYVPLTEDAKMARRLVLHTLYLIETVRPKYWVIENPRNLLRKMDFMDGIDVRTITYCAYGDSRQKPTDLFGVLPTEWLPRPVCARGADCHESAPRGSSTGTQGLSGPEEKGMVPRELSASIKNAIEGKAEPFLMPSPAWGGAVS